MTLAGRTIGRFRILSLLGKGGTLRLLDEMGYCCAGQRREANGRTWVRLRPEDAERIGNNNIVAATDEALVLAPLATAGPWPRARAR